MQNTGAVYWRQQKALQLASDSALFKETAMTQDQDNQIAPSSSAVTLCRKAWTAYLGIGLRAVVLTGLCAGVLIWRRDLWQIIVPILLFGLLLIVYRIAFLRSYKLYYDANGVWIYSGLLPWKRGVTGVKWRDLDEALFVNGFWSWLSGSYTVQLKHRFTKAVEIQVEDMARGKDAVLTINQQQQKYIARQDRQDAAGT